MPEQVRADLTLLEVEQEDALDAARQQPGEAGLAHRQRQPPEILAVADQDIEGVEFDLMIVLPAVQPVEIRSAIDAEQHCLAIDRGAGPFAFAPEGFGSSLK